MVPYILLVEDDADGREMLAEYLQFRGFKVVAAADGKTWIAHARSRRPALILMDLQMPGMTGWEATRRLKAHPDTKDIIVIAMTAHAMVPDEGVARQAGCDGFIPKPFDITAVGDAISDVVRRGRAGLAAVNRLTHPPQKPTKGQRRPLP
jgi:two-component system cell cycle response regulator DivK